MNHKILADKILMIRPSNFGFNESTAFDNKYQNADKQGVLDVDIAKKAHLEFAAFVDVLKKAGITVLEFLDDNDQYTPDSIFPNNWISTHLDGSIWIYPMLCPNRRAERRQDIIDYLQSNFNVTNIFNETDVYERNCQFLEGTGSMVLDRNNKIAYASISKRTNEDLFNTWCQKMGYKPVLFESKDGDRMIYHTNVLMSVCKSMVFICLDAIIHDNQKKMLISLFRDTHKEIINISKHQMNSFLGNVLELKNNQNESILVMSSSAFHALTRPQKTNILKKCQIIHSPLNTIEYFGGGSARCMIAEIFLEPHL